MTHEQKPESAEFRTRDAQITYLGSRIFVGMRNHTDSMCEAQRHIDEAEARGAAEQRKRTAIEDEVENARYADADEESTINALMRRHGIDREEASEELNWWQERDKRFPLNKAGQRRKDAEGIITYEEALRRKCADDVTPALMGSMMKISKLISWLQDVHSNYGDTCVYARSLSWGALALNKEGDDRKALSAEKHAAWTDISPLEGAPVANVAALEARVKELEGEICSIRERVKGAASSVMGIRTDAMNGDNLAITLASYFEDLLGEHDPNGWHPGAQKACDEIEAAIVAHMAAAIREGGEHG